jgi:maltose alpha-D-glucosyltransferase/alpha-amylase
MAERTSIPFAGADLRFEAKGPLPALPEPDLQNVRHVGTEPTNTNIVIDEALFMKVYRSAEPGPNPDLEMSRLLSEAGFGAIAPMLGHISWDNEPPTLLVSLFAYVRNQGDVWNYTLNHLERHVSLISSQDSSVPEAPHALFTTQMQTLGRRIGEMHTILARSSDPAFAPEPIRSQDLSRWYSAVQFDAEAALTALQRRLPSLSEEVRVRAEQLINARERLFSHIRELTAAPIDGLLTRVHGNLHLAKIMLAADDFLLTGFEGDTTLPLQERRHKDSPLHDVASVLLSFQYARTVALGHAISHRPELRERLDPELAEWQLLTTRAFLQGYRRGVIESGILPSTEEGTRRLMKLFMVIRAVHALRHELERRPEMLPTAIDALYEQLSASFE